MGTQRRKDFVDELGLEDSLEIMFENVLCKRISQSTT